MRTKVKQLTAMNVDALRKVGLAATLGVTVAEFDGTPGEALRRVDDQLSSMRQSSTRRSLMAVRRKLQAASTAYLRESWESWDSGENALTQYVTVTI